MDIKDILDRLATYPPLFELEIELENSLPEIVGGVTLVLAKVIKQLDKEHRLVSHELIDEAKSILNLSL